MTKFWIAIASVVITLAVAATTTLIILNNQKIKVEFEFSDIKNIKIYNMSAIANESSKELFDYDEIKNNLNSSMNIKKLSIIGKNIKVNTKVRILPNEKFSNFVLKENKCVELEFEKEQSVIANFNGNTKKLSYTKLLIVLEGKNEICDHTVFYANGNVTFENEPMQFAFSEKALSDLFN